VEKDCLKRTLLYIILLVSIGLSAFSINSPQIRCVQVLPNGEVILTWQDPADPNNEFASYEVYQATSLNGPYTQVQSYPNYGQTQHSTTGCNANQSQYFFYITVKNTSGFESPALDTVRTIFLKITSAINSSVATFQWNDILTPLPAGESTVYKVYREYPQTVWNLIASVPVKPTGNYQYNDSINGICNDSVNYRVELSDPVIPCNSVSNVRGQYFKDINSPAAPLLDSVSVNSSGQAILGIHPSYSSDVQCFVIYIYSGSTYNPVGTICTNNQPTVFTYTASQAGSTSEEFSVAALDQCGNISVIAFGNQATMYLHALYNVCSKSATLTWNPYKNMHGSVHHYEVLCSVNGGSFMHVADTTTTVYTHKNLVQGSSYCYIVRAHSALKALNLRDSITSSSNQFCITPSAGVKPLYVYENDVTVLNPSENAEVKWYIDKNVRVGGFHLYRSENQSGSYSLIGSTGYTAQSNYSFVDYNVNAASASYNYFVVVLDTCMNPIMQTDTSHTILLSANPSGNFKATLNWSDYGRWLAGVSSFNIYRSLDGVFSGGPIATVPAGTFTYVDDLSNYTTYTGKFTYYVEAVEAAGDLYGFTETSQSNYADVYIDAALYVPNAFVPKGHNKIFIPVGDYIEKSEYKFSIFDRWGAKIFETTDENQGWDGGHYEEGIYAWSVEYKTALGEYRQQKGTVMMIH
jgi:hypothetical protein